MYIASENPTPSTLGHPEKKGLKNGVAREPALRRVQKGGGARRMVGAHYSAGACP